MAATQREELVHLASVRDALVAELTATRGEIGVALLRAWQGDELNITEAAAILSLSRKRCYEILAEAGWRR